MIKTNAKTYKALEVLIRNKAVRYDLAEKMIFDAYYYEQLNGDDCADLLDIAKSLCPRG